MSVVFAIASDWSQHRDLLMALGVEEEGLDRMDRIANPEPRRPAQGAARLAEVAAFVEAAGGVMG